MIPNCEYNKCKNAADTNKTGLLRKWGSYHFRENPEHVQDIWLCNKHLSKIRELLNVENREEETSND